MPDHTGRRCSNYYPYTAFSNGPFNLLLNFPSQVLKLLLELSFVLRVKSGETSLSVRPFSFATISITLYKPSSLLSSREIIFTGARTVVHPKARIIAEAGPIVIGEGNLIEEQALIINR